MGSNSRCPPLRERPYIEGAHKGDKLELDEDVVRKIIRFQELTGAVLIDAKAAQAALDTAS